MKPSHHDIPSPAWLPTVAHRLTQWGLDGPALFFLEVHRPWLGVAGAVAVFVQPVLDVLLGAQSAQQLSQWLSAPYSGEQLIEQLAHAQRGGQS